MIYSILKDLSKRKQLGNIIMKVKYSTQSYLLFLIIIAVGIFVIYSTAFRVNQYAMSDYYGIKEIGWLITNGIFYLSLYLKLCLRIVTSREVRENGITLDRGAINYSDIRGLHWISDKKLQINFDPNVVYIFNRQYKEKWVVRDDQVDELKKHFNNKYYEAF